MIEPTFNLLRDILLIAGALFVLSGNIGVLRFPDFFTRVHAAGITDTAGIGLILLGLIVEAGLTLVSLKIVLMLIFLMFTNPTSSHALAKAAIHGGMKPVADFKVKQP